MKVCTRGNVRRLPRVPRSPVRGRETAPFSCHEKMYTDVSNFYTDFDRNGRASLRATFFRCDPRHARPPKCRTCVCQQSAMLWPLQSQLRIVSTDQLHWQ